MNLPKLFSTSRSLGERGIAHFLVPLVVVVLVGLVGTYMVVSSDAATKKSAKPTTTNSKKGFIVVFSQNGDFNRAQISVEGGNPADYKCGKTFSQANRFGNTNAVILNIKQPNAKKAGFTAQSCSPTGGSAYYRVKFGNNITNVNGVNKVTNSNKNATLNLTEPGVVVDVDDGYCVFVHADGKTRKVPNNPNGCNGDYSSEDPPKPLDVTMSSLPALSSDKKKLVGYIGVSVKGKDLRREQCGGSVHVVTTSSNPKTKIAEYDLPLKYTKDKKYNDGNGYCAAKLKSINIKNRGSDQTLNVVATLAQTAYFNAAGPVGNSVVAPGIPTITAVE